MSSSNILIPATKDTFKDVFGNLKKYKQEAVLTENENPISNE